MCFHHVLASCRSHPALPPCTFIMPSSSCRSHHVADVVRSMSVHDVVHSMYFSTMPCPACLSTIAIHRYTHHAIASFRLRYPEPDLFLLRGCFVSQKKGHEPGVCLLRGTYCRGISCVPCALISPQSYTPRQKQNTNSRRVGPPHPQDCPLEKNLRTKTTRRTCLFPYFFGWGRVLGAAAAPLALGCLEFTAADRS